MHRYWKHVTAPLLDAIGARSIVEIGAGRGEHAELLLEYCAAHNGTLTIIDPSPSLDIAAWRRRWGQRLTLLLEPSLTALPKLPSADVVFVDGDHNWYTVTEELRLLHAHRSTAGLPPLLVLHDTDWPYAHRDMYYAPERIPKEHCRPYSRSGMVPGQTGLDSAGVHATYLNANEAGGTHNGVMAAIQDFLAVHAEEYRWHALPGLYGYGILAHRALEERHPALQKLLDAMRLTPFAAAHVHAVDVGQWHERVSLSRHAARQMQHLVGVQAETAELCKKVLLLEQWVRDLESHASELRAHGVRMDSHIHNVRAHAERVERHAQEVQTSLDRITKSKSWRYTAALRQLFPAAQFIKIFPRPTRSFPAALYRLWLACGQPFPGAARFVRYRLLGRIWPVRTAPVVTGGGTLATVAWEPTHTTVAGKHAVNVAVVIPCHNYGNYLREAIESVFAQTCIPSEILVVDDASDDDTAAVAASYAARGVKYKRGEWKSVAAARNAGAMATTAPYLVFLDADDRLCPNYLDACLAQMSDSRVAIAYGDMQEFGDRSTRICMPEFDRNVLERRNYISAHAMIRRQALEVVGGYRELRNAHQDWDLYKRITSMTWIAKKAPTAVEYRVHGDSMLQSYSRTQPSYAHRAGLSSVPVTIFTPFAGRTAVFDRYVHALRSLEYDPSLIRLHWLDTSGKESFEHLLRSTAATMPFAAVTYEKRPLPPLWNQTPEKLIANRVSGAENARHFYQMAVIYAYNHMLTACTTEFLFTLEDDIAPEPSALRRLLETFQEDTVAAVASYPCRFRNCVIVWSKEGSKRIQYPKARTGIEPVAGSGFGCSLFRTNVLRSEPIHYNGDRPDGWYDDVAFAHMRNNGTVLCNWDIRVEHMES